MASLSHGRLIAAAAAMTLSLLCPNPARAQIVVDGILDDLRNAVQVNPSHGCHVTSPLANVFTQTCQFVNGYDVTNGWVYIEEVSGEVNVVVGWEVTGAIGDFDGDTSPNAYSISHGGCSIEADEAGTNREGRTGISSSESYTIELRDCISGTVRRFAIQDNQLVNTETSLPVIGAVYAYQGSFLEARVPGLSGLLEGLDLCDLTVALTAQSEFDGLGSDRTDACALLHPIAVDLDVDTNVQTLCDGETAVYTITVSNSGDCHLDGIVVTHELGSGLTFQSSNPPSTGDSQSREWEFADADLEPGEAIVITVNADFTGPCGGVFPLRSEFTVEGVHAVNGEACPGLVDRKVVVTQNVDLACCGVEPPISDGGACIRGFGFWKQQLEQRGNGSQKFDRDQMDQIAACIDARLGALDWPDDFDGLADALDPPKGKGCRAKVLRHLVGLLANSCAGELGLLTSHGDSIFIDPNMPVQCSGTFPDADTFDELIDAIDDRLVDLSGDDDELCELSECIEDLVDHAEDSSVCDRNGKHDDDDDDDDGDDHKVRLVTSAPNPFSQNTRIDYVVEGTSTEQVRIGVYDVAGRLVRELVSEFQPAGRYQVTWDGRSADGTSMARGVYFLRAGPRSAGGAWRLLYLR